MNFDPELPEEMRFVNTHFTGRPLHTYLWFMWLSASWAVMLTVFSREPGRYSVKAQIFAAMGVLAFLLFTIRLLKLLWNRQNRSWLLAVHNPEAIKTARIDWRILIWLAPVLCLAVLIEFWLMRNWMP